MLQERAFCAAKGSVFSQEKSAYFRFYSVVTERALSYFDRIFLPLTEYVAHIDRIAGNPQVGIALPPVAFDHELATVTLLAKQAVEAGLVSTAADLYDLKQEQLAQLQLEV